MTETTRESGTIAVWRTLFRLSGSGEGVQIALGICTVLVASAAALLQPWPLKLVFDSILGSQPLPELLARASASVAETIPFFSEPRLAGLFLLCAAVLGISVLHGALDVASTYLLVAVGLRMVFRLRCRLFDHLQRLSLSFHDKTAVGDSLYRVTWDTYCVQALFNSAMIPAMTGMFTLLGIATVMLYLDWGLTIVALAIGIPLLLLIQKLDRPMTERSLRFHERESDISARVQETLTGIRAVQAFGREALESQRFCGHAQDSLRANLRLTVLQSGSQVAVGVLLALGTSLIVWMGALRVMDGRLTLGDIVLLVSYLAMLYKPLEDLAYTASVAQSASASGRRVLAWLRAVPEVSDSPGAIDLPDHPTVSIAWDHVSFSYENGKPVLQEVNLAMTPGQSIAIVGPSGAGKTTLATLLLRFYDPTSGRITWNGHDLRSLTIESLRKNIALVLQDPVLFCTSIRENIAYGRPGASLQEIAAAAQAAGAHRFILDLPEGYETKIGERGVTLSGGQRQRISIARAFLKDAPLLIMDEPTSSLDAATETALLEALRTLMAGRTTITIAHRLSTVREVDQIVFLEEGSIAESGTHTELLRRGERYARMYHTQTGMRPVISTGTLA